MLLTSSSVEVSKACYGYHFEGKSIGFVPTMGALHQGHINLVRAATDQCDVVLVSIFVNPLQFDNPEDLEKYPRTLEADLQLLEKEQVEVVFVPEAQHFYIEKPTISINFGPMADVMEGHYRPGHFDGVGVVVSKLLNIVRPNKAFFGLKDLQQYLLIKKMCADLGFQSEIVGVETYRNEEGLALSSRNQRLSASGKKIAAHLYMGLQLVKVGLENGKSLSFVLDEAASFYRSVEGLEMEYLEAIHPGDLRKISSGDGCSELAVCVAGYVDGIRLIDNLYLRLK